MTVTIDPLQDIHFPQVRWLCENLSDKDRAEVMAVQWDDNPQKLAERVMLDREFAWLVRKDGAPAAVIGCAPMWPGMWQAFAFGTDQYKNVILALSRHVRNFIAPALQNFGVRIVQCWVAADYVEARNWLRVVLPNCYEECVVDGFGKNGEAFVLVTWRPMLGKYDVPQPEHRAPVPVMAQ